MLAGAVRVECHEQGIRAFNVDPGFVLTERNAQDLSTTGFDPSWAAPPAAVGAAVAWIVGDSLVQETTTNHPMPSGRAAGYAVASFLTVYGLGFGGLGCCPCSMRSMSGCDSRSWPQGDGSKWRQLCGGGVSL